MLVGKRFTGGEIISKNFRSIQEARKWIFGDAQKLKANPGSLFSIRAASGRVATAQVEGRYGLSEGATDVFEVTPMPPRDSAHCCSREWNSTASIFDLSLNGVLQNRVSVVS